jgi:WD40 repeat protein
MLNRHLKRVSSISLDIAGARLLTGGFDYLIKMWDFAAMDSSFRSFREKIVDDGYPINSVSYNCQGVLLDSPTF